MAGGDNPKAKSDAQEAAARPRAGQGTNDVVEAKSELKAGTDATPATAAAVEAVSEKTWLHGDPKKMAPLSVGFLEQLGKYSVVHSVLSTFGMTDKSRTDAMKQTEGSCITETNPKVKPEQLLELRGKPERTTTPIVQKPGELEFWAGKFGDYHDFSTVDLMPADQKERWFKEREIANKDLKDDYDRYTRLTAAGNYSFVDQLSDQMREMWKFRASNEQLKAYETYETQIKNGDYSSFQKLNDEDFKVIYSRLTFEQKNGMHQYNDVRSALIGVQKGDYTDLASLNPSNQSLESWLKSATPQQRNEYANKVVEFQQRGTQKEANGWFENALPYQKALVLDNLTRMSDADKDAWWKKVANPEASSGNLWSFAQRAYLNAESDLKTGRQLVPNDLPNEQKLLTNIAPLDKLSDTDRLKMGDYSHALSEVKNLSAEQRNSLIKEALSSPNVSAADKQTLQGWGQSPDRQALAAYLSLKQEASGKDLNERLAKADQYSLNIKSGYPEFLDRPDVTPSQLRKWIENAGPDQLKLYSNYIESKSVGDYSFINYENFSQFAKNHPALDEPKVDPDRKGYVDYQDRIAAGDFSFIAKTHAGGDNINNKFRFTDADYAKYQDFLIRQKVGDYSFISKQSIEQQETWRKTATEAEKQAFEKYRENVRQGNFSFVEDLFANRKPPVAKENLSKAREEWIRENETKMFMNRPVIRLGAQEKLPKDATAEERKKAIDDEAKKDREEVEAKIFQPFDVRKAYEGYAKELEAAQTKTDRYRHLDSREMVQNLSTEEQAGYDKWRKAMTLGDFRWVDRLPSADRNALLERYDMALKSGDGNPMKSEAAAYRAYQERVAAGDLSHIYLMDSASFKEWSASATVKEKDHYQDFVNRINAGDLSFVDGYSEATKKDWFSRLELIQNKKPADDGLNEFRENIRVAEKDLEKGYQTYKARTAAGDFSMIDKLNDRNWGRFSITAAPEIWKGYNEYKQRVGSNNYGFVDKLRGPNGESTEQLNAWVLTASQKEKQAYIEYRSKIPGGSIAAPSAELNNIDSYIKTSFQNPLLNSLETPVAVRPPDRIADNMISPEMDGKAIIAQLGKAMRETDSIEDRERIISSISTDATKRIADYLAVDPSAQNIILGTIQYKTAATLKGDAGHGTAGAEFLRKLSEQNPEVKKILVSSLDNLQSGFVPSAIKAQAVQAPATGDGKVTGDVKTAATVTAAPLGLANEAKLRDAVDLGYNYRSSARANLDTVVLVAPKTTKFEAPDKGSDRPIEVGPVIPLTDAAGKIISPVVVTTPGTIPTASPSTGSLIVPPAKTFTETTFNHTSSDVGILRSSAAVVTPTDLTPAQTIASRIDLSRQVYQEAVQIKGTLGAADSGVRSTETRVVEAAALANYGKATNLDTVITKVVVDAITRSSADAYSSSQSTTDSRREAVAQAIAQSMAQTVTLRNEILSTYGFKVTSEIISNQGNRMEASGSLSRIETYAPGSAPAISAPELASRLIRLIEKGAVSLDITGPTKSDGLNRSSIPDQALVGNAAALLSGLKGADGRIVLIDGSGRAISLTEIAAGKFGFHPESGISISRGANTNDLGASGRTLGQQELGTARSSDLTGVRGLFGDPGKIGNVDGSTALGTRFDGRTFVGGDGRIFVGGTPIGDPGSARSGAELSGTRGLTGGQHSADFIGGKIQGQSGDNSGVRVVGPGELGGKASEAGILRGDGKIFPDRIVTETTKSGITSGHTAGGIIQPGRFEGVKGEKSSEIGEKFSDRKSDNKGFVGGGNSSGTSQTNKSDPNNATPGTSIASNGPITLQPVNLPQVQITGQDPKGGHQGQGQTQKEPNSNQANDPKATGSTTDPKATKTQGNTDPKLPVDPKNIDPNATGQLGGALAGTLPGTTPGVGVAVGVVSGTLTPGMTVSPPATDPNANQNDPKTKLPTDPSIVDPNAVPGGSSNTATPTDPQKTDPIANQTTTPDVPTTSVDTVISHEGKHTIDQPVYVQPITDFTPVVAQETKPQHNEVSTEPDVRIQNSNTIVSLENDLLILQAIEKAQQQTQQNDRRVDVIEQNNSNIVSQEGSKQIQPVADIAAIINDAVAPFIQPLIGANPDDARPLTFGILPTEDQVMTTVAQNFDNNPGLNWNISPENAGQNQNEVANLLSAFEATVISIPGNEAEAAQNISQLAAELVQNMSGSMNPDSQIFDPQQISGPSPNALSQLDETIASLIGPKYELADPEQKVNDEDDAKRMAALSHDSLTQHKPEPQDNIRRPEPKQEAAQTQIEPRQKYLVMKGDTLESIAQKRLLNRKLAPLIFEINKSRIPTVNREGKRLLQLKTNLLILLPTRLEIQNYLLRNSSVRCTKFEYDSQVPVANLESLYETALAKILKRCD